MPDVLAVISKAVFERDARGLGPGDVWSTNAYASANKALAPLGDGGRLFLVTVRPPAEAMWLVAVLDQPRFARGAWTAAVNAIAIRDITSLRGKIKFATGAGLPAKAGVLGMSLQTPRVLAAEDVTLLDAAAGALKGAKRAAAKRESSGGAHDVAPVLAEADASALLACWQRTRAPDVADVLQLAPLPLDLAGLARLKPVAASPRIAKLPDDPRTTVFVVENLRAAKWPGSSAKTLWKHAFAKLVALRDRRALAPLRDAAATPPRFLGAAFTKHVVASIAATADALERACATIKPAALPDDIAAIVAAHRAAVPKAGWLARADGSDLEVDALLAQVWADPDDRDLRSVVGDALLERGDPWGELIALQLAGKADKRKVDELVSKHGGRFAGAISNVTARKEMVFENGFLAQVEPDKHMVGRRYWEEAIAAPQWATVHTVRIGYNTPGWWVGAWLAGARLGQLRAVLLGSAEAVRDAAGGAWKLRTKNIRADSMTRHRIEKFTRGLPAAELARMPAPDQPWLRQVLDAIRARRA